MENCLPGAWLPQNLPLGVEWTTLNWKINQEAARLWWDVVLVSFQPLLGTEEP